jgi:hypothetical protein
MLQIRTATIQDATTVALVGIVVVIGMALLRSMIRELAQFERELEMVTILEEDLVRDGFGRTRAFARSLPNGTENPPAMLYSFQPSRPGWAEDYFWKTFLCASPFGGKGLGGRC